MFPLVAKVQSIGHPHASSVEGDLFHIWSGEEIMVDRDREVRYLSAQYLALKGGLPVLNGPRRHEDTKKNDE